MLRAVVNNDHSDADADARVQPAEAAKHSDLRQLEQPSACTFEKMTDLL